MHYYINIAIGFLSFCFFTFMIWKSRKNKKPFGHFLFYVGLSLLLLASGMELVLK